jgi:hypothetical protein
MIRLKSLLEQYALDQSTIQRIATSMGETLGERLGKGANGVAYATTSGRVLKLTQDDYEVALASRLRTKRLYKHIVNVDDVRRIADSDYYVILMDRVTPLNRTEQATWNWIQQRFLDRRNSDEEFRTGQTIALMPSQTRQGEPLDPEFVQRCLAQRAGILRDFAELRIDPNEAHAGNMGWNRHGNLVHFDAWQTEHYTQAQRRYPGEYEYYKALGYKAPRTNRRATQRGFGKPLSVDLSGNE